MSQLFSGKDTCFDANGKVSTHWKYAKGMSLRYDAICTLLTLILG